MVRTPDPTRQRDAERSDAQLDMLHSFAVKLNVLTDTVEIGNTITAELRTIVDYHNCRVYVLQDETRLMPIAFRGELTTEYAEEDLDTLITEIGEGITGTVAATREALLTPDAREVAFSVTIPGTDDDLLESMLAVPMVAGDTLVGVIVLSSLGYGMFDDEDQRMVEVLAPHAAAAFHNASLLEAERDAARAAGALLQLSQSLTGRHTTTEIFRDAIESMETIIRCAATAAYVRDETGAFRVIQLHGCGGRTVRPRAEIADVPATVADTFLTSTAPFVIPQAIAAQVPDDVRIMEASGDVLVCPLQWEPGEVGALIAVGDPGGEPFDEAAVRLARGIGDLTALALGNARRIGELERFHRLVESLDAVFWEAEADGLLVTFLAGRVDELYGADAPAWLDRPWGEHITDADRALAVAEVRRAIAEGTDASVEYRVGAPTGDGRWLRDLVTVVRGSHGPRQLRGLTVDVTERRHAEQTLRESERKYSEAFLREREAAERLRALDEMKNTFLEAVSHDLRTPLTSILGSALTLEQSGLEMPATDALDLVHRVAANARKLERLLGDLLDLDRLQRGIVSPQRRATDIGALIGRVLAEVENPDGRPIDVEVGLLTANVDGPKVERIVENLVANALRHTPPETQVLVWAHAVDGGIEIGVDDAGPGVPADVRESIFEPFEQRPGPTSGHSPGVGIGLSLVRRFAELHDGRAWVEPRDGGGSSFRVFLPNT
jgi:signal transduction histidine kinase/putative methionine-R-sulfoxide reductase with GAF domain